jgi:hypothetical protein
MALWLAIYAGNDPLDRLLAIKRDNNVMIYNNEVNWSLSQLENIQWYFICCVLHFENLLNLLNLVNLDGKYFT